MPANPCRVARSHFSDHLDGEPLPLLGRFLVRLHLAVCPPCQRFHRSLAATQDALHALRDADVAAVAMGNPEGVPQTPPDEQGTGGGSRDL